MRKILSAAAGALLCLAPISGMALTTTPAMASAATPRATSAPAAHVHPQEATPQYQCPIQPGEFDMFKTNNCDDGDAFYVPCGTIAPKGNLPFTPAYASNGCRTRVFLYTATGEGGFSLCIGPRTATYYLHTTYKSFRIGTATSC